MDVILFTWSQVAGSFVKWCSMCLSADLVWHSAFANVVSRHKSLGDGVLSIHEILHLYLAKLIIKTINPKYTQTLVFFEELGWDNSSVCMQYTVQVPHCAFAVGCFVFFFRQHNFINNRKIWVVESENQFSKRIVKDKNSDSIFFLYIFPPLSSLFVGW